MIFGFNWTSHFARYSGSISRFERFVQQWRSGHKFNLATFTIMVEEIFEIWAVKWLFLFSLSSKSYPFGLIPAYTMNPFGMFLTLWKVANRGCTCLCPSPPLSNPPPPPHIVLSLKCIIDVTFMNTESIKSSLIDEYPCVRVFLKLFFWFIQQY